MLKELKEALINLIPENRLTEDYKVLFDNSFLKISSYIDIKNVDLDDSYTLDMLLSVIDYDINNNEMNRISSFTSGNYRESYRGLDSTVFYDDVLSKLSVLGILKSNIIGIAGYGVTQ